MGSDKGSPLDYLRLQNLSIWYDEYQAAKDISLSISQGELFTFLGPSGSGKSTILLCTAGFLSPRSGNVFLQEEDITQIPANLRGIGMVFQSYTLFPHKTVFENIAYPLRVRKVTRAEIKRRVSETAELVGLIGLENRMPNQLSGGQQQRVALARALVFGPRLLLLDEPLGALDKKLREQMEYEVRRIQRTYNSTVLYVTHDQNEAMSISDRLGILRDGRIEQVGTPREVYENPASLFVADFIGGANFFDVKVKSIEDMTCTVAWFNSTIRGVPKPDWLSTSGDSLVMMVRPEHICISGDNSNAEQSIPCHIVESTYLGETQNLHCQLQDGTFVNVREQSSKGLFHDIGQKAFLRFDITKSRLFSAEESRN